MLLMKNNTKVLDDFITYGDDILHSPDYICSCVSVSFNN